MSLLSISRKKDNSKETIKASNEIPLILQNEIRISTTAAKEILNLLGDNSAAAFMRVGIKGGGCSGFSYNYVLEKSAKSNDLIFTEHGVSILVDPKSMKLIGGSLLEWHNEMGSKGFRLRNKQTSKSCSCGQSFSL